MKLNRLTVAIAMASLVGLLSLTIYIHQQSLALGEIRKRLDAQSANDATAERATMERLARVSAVAGAVAVRNEPPQRPSGPADPALPASPAASEPPKPKLTTQEVTDRFTQVFADEAVNESWAKAREQTLIARTQATLPKTSSLLGTECHSSICRIETSHADMSGLRTFLDGALRNHGKNLTTGAVYSTVERKEGDGRVIAVTYIADEGQPLPRIDQM